MSSDRPSEKAAILAARKIDQKILDSGLNAALSFPSDEIRFTQNEINHGVVDALRSKAFSSNPFAKEISGLAQRGIKKIQTKSLSALNHTINEAVSAIETPANNISKENNPFRATGIKEVSSSQPDTLAEKKTYLSENPFIKSASEHRQIAEKFLDTETNTTLVIPDGSVLYRVPSTHKLTVVEYAELHDLAGDKPNAGSNGCSKDGLGIVTPTCERKRQLKK